jgi:hypothetical protein
MILPIPNYLPKASSLNTETVGGHKHLDHKPSLPKKDGPHKHIFIFINSNETQQVKFSIIF